MRSGLGFVFVLVGVLCAGCHRGKLPYYVSINSLSDGKGASKRVYHLLPGLEGVQLEDLQFREFAGQTDLALYVQGFHRAQDLPSAQVLIFLSYGIGAPQNEYYSVPVWGSVPTGTSTAHVNATTSSYGNTSYTHGTVTTQPNMGPGITGYRTESRTTYDRYLLLAAIDAITYKSTGKILPVWRTMVTSHGSSSDLRRVFPIMLGAAMRLIGTDTHGATQIKLREDHPDVLYVRRRITAEQVAPGSR